MELFCSDVVAVREVVDSRDQPGQDDPGETQVYVESSQSDVSQELSEVEETVTEVTDESRKDRVVFHIAEVCVFNSEQSANVMQSLIQEIVLVSVEDEVHESTYSESMFSSKEKCLLCKWYPCWIKE